MGYCSTIIQTCYLCPPGEWFLMGIIQSVTGDMTATTNMETTAK